MEFEFYLVAMGAESMRNIDLVDAAATKGGHVAESFTRTVERALALLATICDRGGANLADSARECDLAPSTALRLLRTLESTGFVTKEEVGGTYRPGSRLIQLGAQALSNESLIDFAKPVMEKLVAETGESAYLSVEGHAS